jgi:hypothetical protein
LTGWSTTTSSTAFWTAGPPEPDTRHLHPAYGVVRFWLGAPRCYRFVRTTGLWRSW